jgi:hypothetical protein
MGINQLNQFAEFQEWKHIKYQDDALLSVTRLCEWNSASNVCSSGVTSCNNSLYVVNVAVDVFFLLYKNKQ